MALAYVLWIVALLGLVVGGLETAARSQVLLSRSLMAEAKAAALAEGALNLVLAELAALPPDAVRTAREVSLPDGTVRVTISDLGGRIDVNQASPALLERALRAAGAAPAMAADLAARIAADRPFLLLDELLGIAGVSPALFQRLGGLLTTFGGHRLVDAAVAPPPVVLALTGMDAGAAERYLAGRDQAGRLAPLAAAEAGPVIGAGFELRAEAASGAGGRVARIAVVKPALLERSAHGLRLVDWQSGRDG